MATYRRTRLALSGLLMVVFQVCVAAKAEETDEMLKGCGGGYVTSMTSVTLGGDFVEMYVVLDNAISKPQIGQTMILSPIGQLDATEIFIKTGGEGGHFELLFDNIQASYMAASPISLHQYGNVDCAGEVQELLFVTCKNEEDPDCAKF